MLICALQPQNCCLSLAIKNICIKGWGSRYTGVIAPDFSSSPRPDHTHLFQAPFSDTTSILQAYPCNIWDTFKLKQNCLMFILSSNLIRHPIFFPVLLSHNWQKLCIKKQLLRALESKERRLDCTLLQLRVMTGVRVPTCKICVFNLSLEPNEGACPNAGE